MGSGFLWETSWIRIQKVKSRKKIGTERKERMKKQKYTVVKKKKKKKFKLLFEICLTFVKDWMEIKLEIVLFTFLTFRNRNQVELNADLDPDTHYNVCRSTAVNKKREN